MAKIHISNNPSFPYASILSDKNKTIDACNIGYLINRRIKEFLEEDITCISGMYHKGWNPKGKYEDIKGFCHSAPIERVQELDYVLIPGWHVALPDEEGGNPHE